MAVAQEANEKPRDWKKKESLSSALLQIAIVAALLGGVVAYRYWNGERRTKIAEGLKEARALSLRGTPQQLDEALGQIDQVLAVNKSSAEAWAVAADIHTEKWLVHGIADSESKAREALKNAADQDSRSEERHATHALHLIADGKPAEAEAYIEELRKQGASSGKLFFALARAYQEQGKRALMREAYDNSIKKSWRSARFTTTFGEALLLEGQYAQALEMFGKAKGVSPEHPYARATAALAQVYKRDGLKDASETLADLVSKENELTPGVKARTYAALAQAYLLEGKAEEALAAADKAKQARPQEPFAYFSRAHALAATKDAAAADAFLEAASHAKTAPLFYFEGATTLSGAGQTDGALALLDRYEQVHQGVQIPAADGKVVNALDKDDRYWIARGDVLKAAGKLDDAMAVYDKAIAADSVNLARAHYAKGALFLAKKDLEKAAETLLPIAPPDGSGSLGEAYLAMGETLFAKKDYANGCQNFAFALTKMRGQPRERLTGILESVNSKLVAAGQKAMAQLWMKEAKPLIP